MSAAMADLEGARSVLVVDDDETFRARLVRAFQERGFEARGRADGAAAIASAANDSPEVAIVDMRMPGLTGLEVVRALREIDATTRIVVLTGYGSIATAIEAIRIGALHYLTKPADIDEILAAIDRSEPNADDPPSSPALASVPTLARVEWEHIHRVLAECGQNVSRAARLLGIHRRSLQRKLSKTPTRR
jgi:two-component system, response regulator RegA